MAELNYALEYFELVKEENINIADLPVELRKRINGLTLQLNRYKSLKQPSTKLRQAIIKADVMICNAIQDWIEKDIPADQQYDEIIAQEKAMEDAAQAAEAAEAAKPKKNEGEGAGDKKGGQASGDKKPQGGSKEQEIRKHLSGNRIRTSKLAEIIGEKPNGKIKVGDLVLKPVYLNSAYYQTV